MAEEKKQEEAVVTLDQLEKSWNDSKTVLKALLGVEDEVQKSTPDKSTEEKGEEDLEKSEEATKEKTEETLEKSEDEEEAEEESEEEDEDDEDNKEVKKSLEDVVSEDSEAAAAMDVEPFLRQLVKSMDEKFTNLSETIKKIAEDNKGNSKAQKALGKALSDLGDQQINIAKSVEVIGGKPVPSRSVLRKSDDRFEDQKSETELNMTKDQILVKALELRKAGKLEMREVTKIENRLNKHIELEPEHIKLLKEEK